MAAPINKTELGTVSGAVFENATENRTFLNVSLQVRYKDGGEWKRKSVSMSPLETAGAIVVLQRQIDFVAMRQMRQKQGGRSTDEDVLASRNEADVPY